MHKFQEDFKEDDLLRHRGECSSMFFKHAFLNQMRGTDNQQLIRDLQEMYPLEAQKDITLLDRYPHLRGRL